MLHQYWRAAFGMLLDKVVDCSRHLCAHKADEEIVCARREQNGHFEMVSMRKR